MFSAAAARLRARLAAYAASQASRQASSSAGPKSDPLGDSFLRLLDRLLDGAISAGRFVHARQNSLMAAYGRYVSLLSFAGPPLGYASYYLYADQFKADLCVEALARVDELPQAENWIGREQEIEQLQALLAGSPERIILLSGGQDSGKSALMNRVLAGRPYVLKMDLQAKSIADVDVFVRYFIESINAQFLSLRTWALDWLPLQGTSNWKWKNKLSLLDFQRALACLNEALVRIREQSGGKALPVICIDDEETLLRLSERGDGRVLVDCLLKWAVHVTKEAQLAHVVFAPSHRFSAAYLSPEGGMEGRVKQICVGDFTRAEAEAFIRSRLPGASEGDVAVAVGALGGRITDLQTFVRSVKAGMTAAAAVAEMVGQAREALRLDLLGRPGPPRRWSPPQAVAALRLLAARHPDGVEAGERDGAASEIKVLREAFEHDAAALAEAVSDGLLALRVGWTPDIGGKPKERTYICPGSPLLLTAFRAMAEDPEDAPLLAAGKEGEEAEAAAAGKQRRVAGVDVVRETRELEQDMAVVEATRPHLRLADKQAALLRAELAQA
eukprot:tig00000880_g5197.t1